MRFGWQVLLPLAVANLVATAIIVTLVPTAAQGWVGLLWGAGVMLIGTLVYAMRRRRMTRAVPVAKSGVALPDSVRLVRIEPTVLPAPSGRGVGGDVRIPPRS
jgi:hypothetical protein